MTLHERTGAPARLFPLLTLLLLLTGPFCHAQQDYVGRYDIYTGVSTLYTPGLNNITQVGFHFQAGINNTRWLATGFDYSVQSGDTGLTANLATQALQEELAAELPPGYVLNIPLHANTQTFTFGTQFNYRHFSWVTLFARPVVDAFRISATPHPTDLIGTIVSEQLVPQGTKLDWVGAYGAGGGADFIVTDHLGIRIQYDGAWNHPFNDILGKGNWSNRFSVGPSFHFGKNVPAHKK